MSSDRPFPTYLARGWLLKASSAFFLVLCAAGPLAVLIVLAARDVPGRRGWVIAAFLASAALAGVMRVVFAAYKRRLRREVARTGGALCRRCGYSLEPRLDGGPCPECGAPVDIAACARAWRRFLGHPSLESPRE